MPIFESNCVLEDRDRAEVNREDHEADQEHRRVPGYIRRELWYAAGAIFSESASVSVSEREPLKCPLLVGVMQ